MLVLVVVVVVGGGGGGGVILGEVKARPKDIISFSLDYISKSKVQTSNPSSSPTPLDTPARPADSATKARIGIATTCGAGQGQLGSQLVSRNEFLGGCKQQRFIQDCRDV